MSSAQIYTSMGNILRKVSAIAKTNTNDFHKFKFRGIDDVLNELHQCFKEEGVFLMQNVIDSKVTERQAKNGTQLHHMLTVKYTFFAQDGSFVESVVMGEAADSGDKSTNKCMSIALKYLLIQTFLIPTAEEKDPDFKSPEFNKLVEISAVTSSVNKPINNGLFNKNLAGHLLILTRVCETLNINAKQKKELSVPLLAMLDGKITATHEAVLDAVTNFIMESK